jgi:hypothetical protein
MPRKGKRRRKKEMAKSRKEKLLKHVYNAETADAIVQLQLEGKLPRGKSHEEVGKVLRRVGYLKYDQNKIAKLMSLYLPHDVVHVPAGPSGPRQVILFELGAIHLVLAKVGIGKKKRDGYIASPAVAKFADDGDCWRNQGGNLMAYDKESRQWVVFTTDGSEETVQPDKHMLAFLDQEYAAMKFHEELRKEGIPF